MGMKMGIGCIYRGYSVSSASASWELLTSWASCITHTGELLLPVASWDMASWELGTAGSHLELGCQIFDFSCKL